MNIISRIEHAIDHAIVEFGLELATLSIDQLTEFCEGPDDGNKFFMQAYLKRSLEKIFLRIQKYRSLTAQADVPRVDIIERIEELKKFQQSFGSIPETVEYIVAFFRTDEEADPDKNVYLKRVKNLSESENRFLQNVFDLPIEFSQFNQKIELNDFVFLFPVLSNTLNQYNDLEIEYQNSISCLIANQTKGLNTKKLLLCFEILEKIDAEAKKKFFRSFIRSFCISKYSEGLNLNNVLLLLSSKEDEILYNEVLDRVIELLKYNFETPYNDDWNSFINNHPYTANGLMTINDETKQVTVNTIGLASSKQQKRNKKELVAQLQGKVVSEDEIMITELSKLLSVRDSQNSILLLGETGVGKTAIANLIHESTRSKKLGGKFVNINCAAIPSELIESELFGFEIGAHGTAEKKYDGKIKLAENGTLFLDEIGKAPLSVQAKLLKFIEEKNYYPLGSNVEKRVNVRIIFATNMNPSVLIKKGQMLLDFYFRISKLKFTIPPLRDRKEDLKNFILYFKNQCDREFNRNIAIDDSALKYALTLEWPGNIRQVENIISQIYVECNSTGVNRISKSMIEKSIENIQNVQSSTSFSNFDDSLRSFFSYWLRFKSEFESIKVDQESHKSGIGDKIQRKYSTRNSHSFLKLIIEPIATHIYKSRGFDVQKSSEILGISLGQGSNYSPFNNRLKLYEQIKNVFEKLEN